ncbi:hypothetical protein TSO221_25370 [Azospirillum sp. TSO22-1]|nr:hypothetical protein TSO221_25370 [Azospirillum sp. TSO22-1]
MAGAFGAAATLGSASAYGLTNFGGGAAGALSKAGDVCLAAFQGNAPALSGPPVKVRFAYNGTGICSASVPVALHRGYFKKHNLDVEFVALAGNTDQMLQALATEKAEVGISMLLSWLKPLESGFDVKLTAGIHGGCVRLLANPQTGITDITKLRGKTIGVSSLAGSPRHFFSVLLAKHGINPDSEVHWREFPADLLGTAVQRGEIQALADSDPTVWLTRQRSNGELVEISSNLVDDYAALSCCTLGIAGPYLRKNPAVGAALTRAVLEAGAHVHANPDDAAAVFGPYTPKVPVADLAAMLRSHTHGHSPTGADLRNEVVKIVGDLKQANIVKPTTDPGRFAAKVVVDLS